MCYFKGTTRGIGMDGLGGLVREGLRGEQGLVAERTRMVAPMGRIRICA